jgi:signal peptidase I
MKARHMKVKSAVRGFIAEWVVTGVVLLFGTTTVLQAFVIPTGSMENTLLVGDHVFVDKLVYSPSDALTKHLLPYRDVERGDVIVFRYPPDIRKTYVKRAIGVPGDRIHLDNKRLVLNGKPMDEPYVVHLQGTVDYRDNFPSSTPVGLVSPRADDMLANHVVNGELAVPPGFIFAMGDNRDNSEDSRFWGLVPRENIIGTPFLIYWSYDAPTQDLNDAPEDPGKGIEHLIDIGTHFFAKTRWDRTLTLVRTYPLQRP